MLTSDRAKINFRAFLWHAVFLALASNFMDVDTIIPSMLIKAGGTSIHLGFLTAIMLGGSSLLQLVFANFISKKTLKKGYLLLGINLRVFSLLALSLLFFKSAELSNQAVIALIFLFIAIFSFSGSFASISYVDILGKSIRQEKRKLFFSSKQIINSVGVLLSAVAARELLKMLGYPANYGTLFLIAAVLLLTASLGFWQIREAPAMLGKKKSFTGFLFSIPGEIRKNPNLKYYLLILNSMGLGLSLLPFIILFAKETFGLSYTLIGNFLLLRTLGMLSAGIVLYRYSKKFLYKHLLMFSLVLGSLLPLLSLACSRNRTLYQMLFFLIGVFVASFKTAISGVLLEISNDENRAHYTGISGAGDVLTTLFPLFAGFLISSLGFHVVFIGVSAAILLSYYFVARLDCRAQQDTQDAA
jgi:MFS family permease